MVSQWVGTRTATSEGGAFRNVTSDGVVMRDFEARNIGVGLASIKKRYGTVKGLTIADGKLHNVGRVLAMPYGDAALDGFVLRNLVITEADMVVRLKNARNGLVEDVHATGSKVPLEDFPSGCMTSDHPTDNVVYRRVTMNRFQQVPVEGKYWNGDGFADEELGTGMVYEDCVACDNADAGFDVKSKGVKLVRCRAERNSRNYRLWGSGELVDIVSVDPRKAHIWAGGSTRLGQYTIVRPMFVGGDSKPHLQVDAGTTASVIRIVDPMDGEGNLIPKDRLRVVKNDTGKSVQVVVEYSSETPPVDPPVDPPVEPPVEPPPPPVDPPAPPVDPPAVRTVTVTFQVNGVTYGGTLAEQA